ncbi:hypothetical protein ACHQM5_016158 [Ranunculus cassubicifolius]
MSLGEKNLREQKQTSIQVIPVRESTSTKWTNEKHSLYLNSMEAMFVSQLYDSLGWSSRWKKQLNPTSSGQSNAKSHTSHQFKILERGCRRKFNSTGSQQHGLEDSTNLSKHDQLCRRVINISRHPAVSNNPPAIQSTDLCQQPLFSFREVSDQNFVDDETTQTNHQNKRKRSRATIADSISNDQCIPTKITRREWTMKFS